MRHVSIKNFSPKITLLGGQSFNWNLYDSWYTGFTQSHVITSRYSTSSNKLLYKCFSPGKATYSLHATPNFSPSNYFRLRLPYQQVLSSFDKDHHTASAIKKYFGLRVLRQDFEQTLLSFILSSQNNIKRIRLIVRRLSDKLGTPVNIGNRSVSLFPSTSALADAPISLLKAAGCGFRSKYIKSSAARLLDMKLASKIAKYTEDKARLALLSFPGVGEKIADCTLLYSLGFDNVMPMDVWCKRVLTDLYGLRGNMRYQDMRSWAEEYFGPYAGWAGQFLFEYLRAKKN